MFAVLQVEQGAEHSFFKCFLHRLRRRSVRVQEVYTPFGAYLQATVYSGEPNWQRVAEQLGRAANNVVLPRGLALPQECVIKRFEPRALSLAVLRETAVDVMRASKIPLYRKSVTLIDPHGKYSGFVRALLCHCMTVKVVTQAHTLYAALCEELLEELGAGIVYADSEGLCADSVLVIAPDSADAATLNTRAPVLTADEPGIYPGCRLVGAPRIRAPDAFAQFVPQGIDALDFFGALYAQGTVPRGVVCAACTLRCGSRELSIDDIVKYIMNWFTDN